MVAVHTFEAVKCWAILLLSQLAKRQTEGVSGRLALLPIYEACSSVLAALQLFSLTPFKVLTAVRGVCMSVMSVTNMFGAEILTEPIPVYQAQYM